MANSIHVSYQKSSIGFHPNYYNRMLPILPVVKRYDNLLEEQIPISSQE